MRQNKIRQFAPPSPYMHLRSLLDIPDGNLAIQVCGTTQDVAVLSRAQCLDAVSVGLQLFCHTAALWVHHHHQTSHLPLILTCDITIAAHPHLRGGHRGWAAIKNAHLLCLSILKHTWFLT